MDISTLKVAHRLAGQPGGWRDLALCAEVDPELFFPEKGESSRPAKRVCAGCEVRAECLQYALDHSERFGVWGGLSERERRELARQPNLARSCPVHEAALSGGPALYSCPAGHRITATDLEKDAAVAAPGQVAA
jgi:WhiB family redox-sensing transcriptional regulator